MTPRRVQRTRTKGGGMPAGAVYVGRPTKWGNPYVPRAYAFENPDGTPAPWDEIEARRMAVRDYEHQLRCGRLRVTVEDVRRELRGKDLACWCKDGAVCHADVLLEVANEESDRCPHPARDGLHEWYVDGPGYVCRACGERRTIDD